MKVALSDDFSNIITKSQSGDMGENLKDLILLDSN